MMPNSEYITIVSGLPRSGTSMMMKMLEQGGLPVVTDRLRTADDDNPNGYYEFEPVKKTRDDPSWLPDARGKVVKMVYSLLRDLPANFKYRVVFMRRALPEVIASQNKMLRRHGKDPKPGDDALMMGLFEKELQKIEEWLELQPNFETVYVWYNELLGGPQETVKVINEFCDGVLDEAAMCTVIDPNLYRNRA
ncbi:MAG: sulfotransferase domain-containing protein [Maioricimonas sp. JB045]|uniref:sulfotransferase domain-containing protein n=1 Tax=Maioricimonas sp. JC845 TaxID=3232138 RepID=UPI003458C13F